MRETKRFAVRATGALLLCFLGATAASAAAIQFSQSDAVANANKGSLVYGGAGGPLFGQTIGLDQLSLLGASAPSGHDNSLACFGCALNFNTGLNSLEGPNLWVFNTLASSFTITGDAYPVNADGTMADTPIASGALVTGGFNEPQRVSYDAFTPGAVLRFDGIGTDEKSTGLLDYFGLDTRRGSSFDAELTGAGAFVEADGGFASNVAGASVLNRVPEPGSAAILGLGVFLVGLGLRRGGRRRAQARIG